jgi:hypothetical protein
MDKLKKVLYNKCLDYLESLDIKIKLERSTSLTKYYFILLNSFVISITSCSLLILILLKSCNLTKITINLIFFL